MSKGGLIVNIRTVVMSEDGICIEGRWKQATSSQV